jgi:ADP-glucose pyrophosphorylase
MIDVRGAEMAEGTPTMPRVVGFVSGVRKGTRLYRLSAGQSKPAPTFSEHHRLIDLAQATGE